LTSPVNGFRLPVGEFKHSAPHLLNEYNAGTILQRIASLLGTFDDRTAGIEEADGGFLGMGYFENDNIHVRPEMVGMIMSHLLANDYPESAAVAMPGARTFGYADAEPLERLND
jgi:hypothetical protein